eukprot:TRINITY_DN40539_c0_g1_i2.p3 TRINITY_DN40539_c0_g1~~TRINITY_DN40539_c0_g1_i2.p3  ORF type:complete len:123 (-),score=6.45 TRINITY_DN40539_c0_g1_i2:47-415(-)
MCNFFLFGGKQFFYCCQDFLNQVHAQNKVAIYSWGSVLVGAVQHSKFQIFLTINFCIYACVVIVKTCLVGSNFSIVVKISQIKCTRKIKLQYILGVVFWLEQSSIPSFKYFLPQIFVFTHAL